MRPKDAGASSQIEDANVLLLHAPVHMMIFEVEWQYLAHPREHRGALNLWKNAKPLWRV